MKITLMQFLYIRNLVLKKLELEENIIFLGKKQNPYPYFKISDCVILSSDYEGVPNVLIEAMAVGTPSVSTDCAPGGAATLIRSGENGILTPVGDLAALAEEWRIILDYLY